MELEHKTYMAVAESRQLFIVERVDTLAINSDISFSWPVQGAEDMQESAFSRAGRAYNTDYFPLIQFQVNAL